MASEVLTPSVIFRPGPLTAEDYDEAIEMLRAARRAFADPPPVCSVCHDSGHTAETCHHNPLRVARDRHFDDAYWICFHCGAEFSEAEVEAAQDHFGASRDEMAECQRALRDILHKVVRECLDEAKARGGPVTMSHRLAEKILESLRAPTPTKDPS